MTSLERVAAKLDATVCMEMQVAAGKVTILTQRLTSECFHTNRILILITLV